VQTKATYTLGKNERLKSRKAIDHLFKDGKAFSVFPFRVIYLLKKFEQQNSIPTSNISQQTSYNVNDNNNIVHRTPNIVDTPVITHLQTGVTVSKKYFKKAVSRNRIKRLMKEAYRLQKNDLQNELTQKNIQLECFLMYTGNELPEYNLVFEKMTNILKRLQKIVHENIQANN
jgi:ribonuclease P protein component